MEQFRYHFITIVKSTVITFSLLWKKCYMVELSMTKNCYWLNRFSSLFGVIGGKSKQNCPILYNWQHFKHARCASYYYQKRTWNLLNFLQDNVLSPLFLMRRGIIEKSHFDMGKLNMRWNEIISKRMQMVGFLGFP